MKRKILPAVSILLMMAGIGTICGVQVLTDRKMIGDIVTIIWKVAGMLCLMGVVACMYSYLGKLVEEDEELQREEQDERNEMIRGKAAQNTVLLMTVLMLFVELLFIYLGYFIPALIVAAAMFVGVQGQLLLISYYQKKY